MIFHFVVYVQQIPIESKMLKFSLLQLAILELVSVFMPIDILQLMVLVMIAPILWYSERGKLI